MSGPWALPGKTVLNRTLSGLPLVLQGRRLGKGRLQVVNSATNRGPPWKGVSQPNRLNRGF